jgi:DNA recombination protein RmuC
VRQIQAAELVDDAVKVEPMVGRSSRRRPHPIEPSVPEAAELVRPEPDLLELIESTSGVPDEQERASS